MAEYDVRIIRSLADVDAFLPAWREFLSDDADDHDVYQTPEYARGFFEDREMYSPRLVVVCQAGRIAAVAPCYLHKTRFRLTFSILELAGFRCQVLKVLGASWVFAASADRAAIARLIFATLRAEGLRVFSIYNLRASGEFWELLQREDVRAGFRMRFVSARAEKIHQLELTDSFDRYLASLGSKTRRNIRVKTRTLARAVDGHPELVRISQVEQVGWFLDRVDEEFAQSWQCASFGYASQNNDANVCALKDLARRGYLRSYLLLGRGRPLAYVIGYQYRGRFHHDSTAYDQRIGHLAPGSVLTRLLIEDLFGHERPAVLDFGFGDNQYKRVFGNASRDAYSAYLVCSWRWRGLLATQRAIGELEHRLRSILMQFKLDSAARAILRHRSRWIQTLRPDLPHNLFSRRKRASMVPAQAFRPDS